MKTKLIFREKRRKFFWKTCEQKRPHTPQILIDFRRKSCYTLDSVINNVNVSQVFFVSHSLGGLQDLCLFVWRLRTQSLFLYGGTTMNNGTVKWFNAEKGSRLHFQRWGRARRIRTFLRNSGRRLQDAERRPEGHLWDRDRPEERQAPRSKCRKALIVN